MMPFTDVFSGIESVFTQDSKRPTVRLLDQPWNTTWESTQQKQNSRIQGRGGDSHGPVQELTGDAIIDIGPSHRPILPPIVSYIWYVPMWLVIAAVFLVSRLLIFMQIAVNFTRTSPLFVLSCPQSRIRSTRRTWLDGMGAYISQSSGRPSLLSASCIRCLPSLRHKSYH
jgi:hypothetical protein